MRAAVVPASPRRAALGQALALAGAAFAVLAASAAAAASRGALWQVEQLCLLNHAVTGTSLPCLEVSVAGGEARGYVVLRPPFGPPDTILAPTRKIAGIEDAALQAADAPNYFALAWQATGFVSAKAGRRLARQELGLAINSTLTRSQDQMHIHVECLARDVQAFVRDTERGLAGPQWQQLKRPLRRLNFWARRLSADEFPGFNPFSAVAREVPPARRGMGEMTILLAGSPGGGFVVLAASIRDAEPGRGVTVEKLLDHSCTR